MECEIGGWAKTFLIVAHRAKYSVEMAAASLMLQGEFSNPNPVLYTSSQKSTDRCQDAIINEIFGE